MNLAKEFKDISAAVHALPEARLRTLCAELAVWFEYEPDCLVSATATQQQMADWIMGTDPMFQIGGTCDFLIQKGVLKTAN